MNTTTRAQHINKRQDAIWERCQVAKSNQLYFAQNGRQLDVHRRDYQQSREFTIASDVRTKHTPNCRHKYTATPKGCGIYGWGNTPDEARQCLLRRLNT